MFVVKLRINGGILTENGYYEALPLHAPHGPKSEFIFTPKFRPDIRRLPLDRYLDNKPAYITTWPKR